MKAYILMIGFFYFIPKIAFGQDQKIADSLAIIYLKDSVTGIGKLELLKTLTFNELNDSELSLKYAEELITLSEIDKNNYYLFSGYLQKGETHEKNGDLQLALEAYFKSTEIAVDSYYVVLEGAAYMSIADVYSVMGSSDNAELYYNKSIQILRNTNDSITLATALLNAGDNFFNTSKLEDALKYFEESGRIFKEVNYLVGTAYNLGNTGMVYAEQGKDVLAKQNINEAITILEELEDYYPIAIYLTYMSDIYLRQNDFTTALSYANRSLELATTYGLKEQISDANYQLSNLYEQAGNLEESYKYYKNHIAYRDSVNNIENVQQIADLRTDFEVSQKQSEVDLLNQKRKNQRIINIAGALSTIFILLFAIALYRRYIFIKKTNTLIENEKNRSETLLLNILPEETARELKQRGKVQAKKFDSVTVLFTDFKGFTKLVESVEPDRLIRSLDFYFKKFDEVTTKYGLEKIKTIGDSYMCAGGLPTTCKSHARNVINAAKEINDLVKGELKAADDLLHFEIRIGIHTGPVIAGIVGLKKWQYDIWGDTVNIASRMESNSEPGRINLSETTYQEVRDEYSCEYRGEVEVKNRGALKMYFLS